MLVRARHQTRIGKRIERGARVLERSARAHDRLLRDPFEIVLLFLDRDDPRNIDHRGNRYDRPKQAEENGRRNHPRTSQFHCRNL